MCTAVIFMVCCQPKRLSILGTNSLLMGCIFWLSILDHSSMSLRMSERAAVGYIQLNITTNQTTCGALWKGVQNEEYAAEQVITSSTKQTLQG